MRFLPLLLLLSACATSPGARTTYSQSAPVPEFEPAWTAPHTTGQPGYVSPEDVPRSPHKRVLPQTPETMRGPGIWASDGPYELTRERPAILGVTLPMPEPEEDGTLNPEIEWTCARTMNVALAKAAREYRTFTQPMRDCLAARLFAWCADEFAEAGRRGKQEGTDYDPDRMRREAGAAHRSSLFESSKCEDVKNSDKIEAARRTVVQQWMLDLKWRNK